MAVAGVGAIFRKRMCACVCVNAGEINALISKMAANAKSKLLAQSQSQSPLPLTSPRFARNATMRCCPPSPHACTCSALALSLSHSLALPLSTLHTLFAFA